MYVRRLGIKNIRSIENFEIRFREEEAPGWHVILGANGSGKSSVVRSLALALTGPKEAAALRQNWNSWVRYGTSDSHIDLQFQLGPKDVLTGQGARGKLVDVKLDFRPIETSIGGPRIELVAGKGRAQAERSIWGTNTGWFSASFGPFRRFTGGDHTFDRLFYSNPRLAPHLSAFGEDVALTEGLRWLRDLRIKQLENDTPSNNLFFLSLKHFLNNSELLPNGGQITEVTSEEVIIIDAAGTQIIVEQMSDGYRSILSMIFEILRQMAKSFGVAELAEALSLTKAEVRLPGVVVIDEVDAHLHPSWQRDIGPWFTRCFPEVQFIVTTHSPIICRNATSVWRLAEPGSDEVSGRIENGALNRLIHGSILDAYGTEFFGRDIARSADSKELLTELAQLNRKALRDGLNPGEQTRMDELRKMLPTRAADTAET
jgi:predicted ATPase